MINKFLKKMALIAVMALFLTSCEKTVHSHQMWKWQEGTWVGDILHTPSQVNGDIIYQQGKPVA